MKMNKPFYDSLKLGILGGGQLGRMLLQKAADFNISNLVLDPDENAPCRYISETFVHGSFGEYDTVYSFGKECDLITIEIEHVNTDALIQLESEGKIIHPSTKIIRLVQDKGAQKIFFRTNGIPTAEFQLIESKKELTAAGFPCIQKLRTGGYDGRGVFRLDEKGDIDLAFDEPSVIEKIIPFKKEISVIVARNASGACKTYPAVEMEFNPQAHLVEFLFSPADISEKAEKESRDIAIRLAEALQLTGILAVEMFLLDNDTLLVNEMAPRPHNSGHHTIEANVTSQYEQHLRAILNLPLGNTEMISPAAMVNLLGEEDHTGHVRFQGIEELMAMEGVKIHLYGKKITKPYRKMGHVTILASDSKTLRSKAREVRNLCRVISEPENTFI